MDESNWWKYAAAAAPGVLLGALKIAELVKSWLAQRSTETVEKGKLVLAHDQLELDAERADFAEIEAVNARVSKEQAALIAALGEQLVALQARVLASDKRSDEQDRRADERARAHQAVVEELRAKAQAEAGHRYECLEELRGVKHELANVRQAMQLDRERLRETLHLPPVDSAVDPTKESRLTPAGATPALTVGTMVVDKIELKDPSK